jgi:hypothetical protein
MSWMKPGLTAALPAAPQATPAPREVAAPIVIPVESAASVWWPLREALGGAAELAASIVVGGGVGNVSRPAAM